MRNLENGAAVCSQSHLRKHDRKLLRGPRHRAEISTKLADCMKRAQQDAGKGAKRRHGHSDETIIGKHRLHDQPFKRLLYYREETPRCSEDEGGGPDEDESQERPITTVQVAVHAAVQAIRGHDEGAPTLESEASRRVSFIGVDRRIYARSYLLTVTASLSLS